MADVGLVGFPNSGKSTLISRVSKARPKIADYPFTTIIPQLGVVKTKNIDPFVIADVPGIIEGAHLGKGLGDRFLRHIERTFCLVIMLDVSGFSENPPKQEYFTLIEELKLFSSKLIQKSRIIVLTKIDSVTNIEELDKLQLMLESNKERVFRISSLNGEGIQELLNSLGEMVKKQKSFEVKNNLEIHNSSISANSIWKD